MHEEQLEAMKQARLLQQHHAQAEAARLAGKYQGVTPSMAEAAVAAKRKIAQENDALRAQKMAEQELDEDMSTEGDTCRAL
jgi:hypothetical protein